jgi:hypothetical protein
MWEKPGQSRLGWNGLHPGRSRARRPRRRRVSSASRPHWARTPRPANVHWSVRSAGSLVRDTRWGSGRRHASRSHPQPVAPPSAIGSRARAHRRRPHRQGTRAYLRAGARRPRAMPPVTRVVVVRHWRPHGELPLPTNTVTPRVLYLFPQAPLEPPHLLVAQVDPQFRRSPSSSGARRPAPPATPSGRFLVANKHPNRP